jgi:LacI family transcriptional regulator
VSTFSPTTGGFLYPPHFSPAGAPDLALPMARSQRSKTRPARASLKRVVERTIAVERPARKRVLLMLSYYDHRHHAGVARYAGEAGWIIDDAATQERGLPADWSGDGIISFHGADPEFLKYLRALNVPVVDIGEFDEFSDYPRVRTDSRAIGRAAAEFFAAREFRNVGFVANAANGLQQRRSGALREAAESLGQTFLEVPLPEIGLLAGRPGALPIGLLAANDLVAVRALAACEEAGLLVPEQVALMGIDNDEYRCAPALVPLTSIDADHERVGYEAAALLDRLMHGEPAPAKPIEVPPRGIVERESTNILAVQDLQVASALRFILQNFRREIGLQEVAASTNLSLRRLQTRFKEHLGRTILQEINGRRVEHAKRLLGGTNLKIRAVATESGFGSAVRLIRVFRQYTHQSPRQYRKEHNRAAAAAASRPQPRDVVAHEHGPRERA